MLEIVQRYLIKTIVNTYLLLIPRHNLKPIYSPIRMVFFFNVIYLIVPKEMIINGTWNEKKAK